MRISNPRSRFKLHINKSDKVLEVGGGHNPHPRSNVMVDKYTGDSNYHRNGDLKVLKHQQFLEADGENLPFKDKEFDYVICCHVLEHTEHPERFLKEQARVSKRGYIETPSLFGEHLSPKESHRWILLDIDDKIVMYEKSKVNFNLSLNLGWAFQRYLPTNSIGFKLLERTHHEIMTMNYEWEGSIDYLINPEDEKYKRFFTQPWDEEMCNKIFRKRSMGQEVKDSLSGIVDIAKGVFNSKVLKKQR